MFLRLLFGSCCLVLPFRYCGNLMFFLTNKNPGWDTEHAVLCCSAPLLSASGPAAARDSSAFQGGISPFRSSRCAGFTALHPRLCRCLPGRLCGRVPVQVGRWGQMCPAPCARVTQVSYSLWRSWTGSVRKPVLNFRHQGILKLSRSLVN